MYIQLFLDQRLSCGGIRTSQDGEIVFSGTELTIDDNFSSVILCIWVIAVANQEVTELQFTNINIDSEENCSDNSIQV